MKTNPWMSALTVLAFFAAAGCEQAANAPADAPVEAGAHAGAADEHEHGEGEHLASAEAAGHNHRGWWCAEHGVPEEVCALCNSKVAAEFQKKGDWCEEHDRPDSQCFIHHPELKEKFAAQYVAKFGEQPPEPQE